MARIQGIELTSLAAPVPEPYGMARGLATARQATIVHLRTDAGIEGIGEAWGPSAIVAAYLDIVRPYFIGREVYDCEAIAAMILAKHYHFGIQNQLTACLSGIDVAALDAMGKLHGLPVAKLLGGVVHRELPVYASGGYITTTPERSFPAQLERLVAAGAGAAKIKIGLGPASDEKRVAAAREALGPDALLMVDANGNYTVDVALESMRRIAPHGVHWYEEPLAPLDFDGYAELRRKAPMPIATGEALYTAWDFKRLLDARGVDVVQPDVSLCGGLRTAREIAALARLHHVRLSPHVWGGGLGLAAACHFVASLPDYPHNGNIPYPPFIEYDVGQNPLRDEILAEPIRLEKGRLLLPEKPGLGVELDPEAVARFRVG